MRDISGAGNTRWSIAMVVAVPILAWSARSFTGVSASMEAQATQMARELAVARTERLLDSAAAIRLQVLGMAQQEWFIEARSPSLGAAAFTRHLMAVADENDIALESVQPIATRSSRNGTLRLKAFVTGSFRSVARFVAAVEQGPPRVVIRETSLSMPTGAAGAARTDLVKAQLVLELLLELKNRPTGLAAR